MLKYGKKLLPNRLTDRRTWSPIATMRCFSTSGLPRQNQHGPLGAGGRVGGWDGAEDDWERRGARLA